MSKNIETLGIDPLCKFENEFEILNSDLSKHGDPQHIDNSLASELEDFLERLRKYRRILKRELADLKDLCPFTDNDAKTKSEQIEKLEDKIGALDDMEKEITDNITEMYL